MESLLGQINEALNNEEKADVTDCKLYIIGSTIKDGTKTKYEDAKLYEIVVDDSVTEFLLDSAKGTLHYLLDGESFEFYDIDDVDEGGENIKRYISVPHLSDLDIWQSTIIDGKADNAHEILNREDFKPKAFVCTIRVDDLEIFLIKSISESALLKNKTILKVLNRGVYGIDQDEYRKVFIDRDWDALSDKNNVLLLNEKRVLDMFRYYEKFREAAKVTLDKITNLDLLSNIENLAEFVQDRVLLQKRLARASLYPLDDIKKDRIKELIRDGVIQLPLNAEGKIECSTLQEAKIVIDVLLDNFVTSMITEEQYKALNKTSISK
jgi:hypothetical protein